MLTILITIFLLILIPIYWKKYGPQNFLWLSDIGLFLTFFALWFQSPLLMSMAMVGIFVLEIIWVIDYFVRLTTGHIFLDITDYMFDPGLSKFVRSLSFFHIVTPAIWVWFLFKWGYDPRAFWYQTGLVWIILLLTYFCTDPKKNINWVFFPQIRHWNIPSYVWLIILLIGFPVVIFLPMHIFLMRFF